MNGRFGLSDKTIAVIIEAIGRFPEIEKAAIFGSRALGNHKSGSDIDLALFGKDVGESTIGRLSRWLNEESSLPYMVDVVGVELCENQELRRHILEKGIDLVLTKA